MTPTERAQLLRELAERLEPCPESQHLAERARAAAAEIEGRKMPSRDDLMQILFASFRGPIEFVCDTQEEGELMAKSHVKFALAMLARYGGGEVG